MVIEVRIRKKEEKVAGLPSISEKTFGIGKEVKSRKNPIELLLNMTVSMMKRRKPGKSNLKSVGVLLYRIGSIVNILVCCVCRSKFTMVKDMASIQPAIERSSSPSSDDNRQMTRSQDGSPQSPQRAGPGAIGKDKGMSLAQRMLEKFGWREGEGLGKARQGMATPLIAQKTDKRSAVIVNAEKRKTAEVTPMMPPDKKPKVVCSKWNAQEQL